MLTTKTLMPTVRLPAQAPALVLLHGWGASSAVWEPVLPLLQTCFQITLIDLPGHGASSGPLPGNTLAEWRDAVLRVAPPQAIWLGWSLGGLLALAVAHHAPERVVALALVAATPCFVQREDWPHAMSPTVFEQFRSQVGARPEQALSRFYALQCLGSPSMKNDLRLLQAAFFEGAISTDALAAGLDLLASSDLRAELAALDLPVMLTLGEADQLVPERVQADLQALHAGAEVAVIGGSAHLPFLSQPAEFAERFLVFCHLHGVLS